VAGTIGVLQASEALKEILGIGKSMAGRLLLFNALSLTFEVVELQRNPSCPLCGEQPSIKELVDYPLTCQAATA
jgi:molybdopterin/thiamine biosynthesis adenylyltransferase